MDQSSLKALLARIDALETDNRLLREALEVAAYGRAAQASSQATSEVGRASLLASETAQASSQREMRVGRATLLASETALASSQEETRVGRATLLASEIALASSQEETR